MSMQIELQFLPDPKGWVLERVRFASGTGQEWVESFRGDRFSQVGRSFSWTRGIRALVLLLVRHAQQDGGAAEVRLEGGRESPAQTLVNLLEHPERSTAAQPFTCQAGVCHLKKLLEMANAGKQAGGMTCWQVWVRPEHLPPSQTVIMLDGDRLPLGDPRWLALEKDLRGAWPRWQLARCPTGAPAGEPPPAVVPLPVELGRFPMLHGVLLGREDALQGLSAAVRASRTVQVIGSGGAGKSSLACHWLEQVQRQPLGLWGGVFGWSFAEQSRASDHTMAVEDCLRALLHFCGDSQADEAGSAYQRGVAAARAAAERGLLVVVDGVETLQIAEGPELGTPHDPGLRGFLHTVARLPVTRLRCVLISRIEIPPPLGGQVIRLGRLDEAAALILLKGQGVEGAEVDMQRLVAISHGHPLTLQLMAHYLRRAHHGQARALAEDGHLLATDAPLAHHAHAMMSGYENDLASTARGRLLYLLSLYDRPVTLDELSDLLFHGPELPAFQGFFPTSAALRATAHELAADDLLTLDTHLSCHPLVIRHFGEGFRHKFAADYRRAHAWLYQRICQDPAIPTHPTTREQYEALLTAFHHGREAGKLAECWQEIAWHRIMRDGKAYHMTGDLAEFHLCLRTWAAFWKIPWEELHPDLPAAAHPIVQGSAGFCLFMIERVEESERVLHRALGNSLRSARPHHLLQPAAVLGLIRMHQGRYQEARRILAPIAQIARWTGPFTDAPDHVLLSPLCHLAYSHHGLGNTRTARRLFQRAIRQHQGKSGWELPPLLIVSYWRFLLEVGDLASYRASAEQTGHIIQAESMPLLHQTGMVRILRAQAAFLHWQRTGQANALAEADAQSAAACRQSDENGFRMFHCTNLHVRQAILTALNRPTAAADLQTEVATLAAQFGLRQYPQENKRLTVKPPPSAAGASRWAVNPAREPPFSY